MYKFKLNRRGVSPVIATLLLVAIAVAASVVTYTWAMSMTANQSAQSQTGIKIDQVRFGQAASAITTVTDDAANDQNSFLVSSAASLAVDDYVKVYSSSTVYGISKITGIAGNVITVAPDLSGEPAALATVEKQINGLWISVRNTGSIAATVQTVYLFKGDALITSKTYATATTLAAGNVKNLGISETTWAQLKSGGLAIPTADTASLVENADFGQDLAVNTPYKIKIVTSTGFVAEGTYYTPGSFS